MMRALASFSVRNPVVVNLYLIAIILGGLAAASTLRREFFPEVRTNRVLVTAPYPGAQPAEIEQSLTRKIEDALTDLENVKEITSTASEGITTVRVEFEPGVEITDAVSKVKRRVDALQDLPEASERIVVAELEPNLPVISLNLSAEPTEADERALKRAAEEIRDHLRSLPGMGTIAVSGVRPDEITVAVRPAALLEHGLSISQVADLIRAAMADAPGGSVRSGTQTVAVRTMATPETAEAVRRIVLKGAGGGAVVTVADIAEVSLGFADVDLRTRLNGKPSVNLTAFKVGQQDAVQIADMVRAYADGRLGKDFHPGLLERLHGLIGGVGPRKAAWQLGAGAGGPPPGTLTVTNDLSRFITGRLELLSRNAVSGAAVVFVLLALFLNFRVAVWITSGLVTAVFGTLILMGVLGVTLNLLTMFGLIIVLGMLVDDGIVVGENIYRRFQEGEPPLLAGVNGTTEVAWPVVATVSTTIFSFMSLLVIEGQIGDFLGVLPKIVAIALIISLVECILALPGHLSHGLRKAVERPSRFDRLCRTFDTWRDDKINRYVIPAFSSVLRWCLDHRGLTICTAVALLMASLGMVAGGRVAFVFLGSTDAETILAEVRMPIGTPIGRTEDIINRLEKAALAQPEVSYVFSQAGAQTSLDGLDSLSQSHLGQLFIELKPVEERQAKGMRPSDELITVIRREAGDLPGVQKVRMDSLQGGPEGPPISFTVSAPQIERVDAAVARVIDLLAGFKGVYDVSSDADGGLRELQIDLRPGAAELGFTVASVARQVRGAVFGLEAHTFASPMGQEDVDVRVIYQAEARRSLSAMESMRVISPAGLAVPLTEVAQVRETAGFATVRRLDRVRAVTITAEVDRALANPEAVTRAVTPTLRQIEAELGGGLTIQPRGRQQETAESLGSLPLGAALAVGLIVINLCWVFKSYTRPIAIMLSIPFSIIGMVWGHLVMGYDMTILSLIGLVALAGVVVNDSIVFIEFYAQARRQGANAYRAALEAGPARLRPIFLTTVTTVGGLGPLLLEQSFQAKFLIPMVIIICGGLIVATVQTLIVLPCVLVLGDDASTTLKALWTGRSRRDIAADPPDRDWDAELAAQEAAIRESDRSMIHR